MTPRVRPPGSRKEESRRRYLKFREKLLERGKEWQAANPEKRKAIYTRYRTEKVEVARANEQAYRDRNREACNARIREWKAKNRHKVEQARAARRVQQKLAVPAWASKERLEAIYAERARVSAATGVVHHVDHIVPIMHPLVCGLHCEANLRVIPGKENAKKVNYTWPDMPDERPVLRRSRS